MEAFIHEKYKNGIRKVARPFSGDERNRLFIQTDRNFHDVSLVSGVDFREDGRGLALWDFDKDGWLDMAIPSPNKPRLRIVRNLIGDRGQSYGAIAIRLVGGMSGTEQSEERYSTRDAIGAVVTVEDGSKKRAFQRSCGDGLACQNSEWIHAGLGKTSTVKRILVQWPSGVRTEELNVSRNTAITIFENGESSIVSAR